MMKDSQPFINNNGNKDSDDSKSNWIILNLSEELKSANIVSEIKYLPKQSQLKITFSNIYNNEKLFIPVDLKNWSKWAEKLESKIKIRMPQLNNRDRLLIENTIHENLDLLLDDADANSYDLQSTAVEEEKQEVVKKIHLRKYVLDGQLYESVIVNKNPKFLAIINTENSIDNNDESSSKEKSDNNTQFKLIDKIEVPNYEFYPADTLVTHNPIPYSFESEEELKIYIELAKKETFDSLFQRILEQIRNFVNNDEHVLIILAADILYSYFQEKNLEQLITISL